MNLPPFALTLWPEWAWAICHLDKRVENRTWAPGARLPVGSRLAIHAGKYIGGTLGATDEGVEAVRFMARGAQTVGIDRCTTSAIVAVVTIDGFDQEQRTKWDVPGLWHWRFRDVEVLATPIPCRGAQGLWAVKS